MLISNVVWILFLNGPVTTLRIFIQRYDQLINVFDQFSNLFKKYIL